MWWTWGDSNPRLIRAKDVCYQLYHKPIKILRREGLEPSRFCNQQILSLSRLPIPPPPLKYVVAETRTLLKHPTSI